MPTIDADAHVIECEQTWSYIENEKLRPFLISPGGGRPQNWLVDAKAKVRRKATGFDATHPERFVTEVKSGLEQLKKN